MRQRIARGIAKRIRRRKSWQLLADAVRAALRSEARGAAFLFYLGVLLVCLAADAALVALFGRQNLGAISLTTTILMLALLRAWS